MCAGTALAVVGCTKVTDGTVTANQSEAPSYRTSVSSSRSAAAVTSSEREASRQAAATTEAVHTACETLSTSSADAVKNVNAYVDAANTGGDTAATIGPARDSLNTSADQVAADTTDTLPQTIKDALNGWVAAARDAAVVLAGEPTAEAFNAAVTKVNEARTNALNLCDAAY